MGNGAGCEGGENIGYWRYTVSCSGILLHGLIRIGDVQTGLIPYVWGGSSFTCWNGTSSRGGKCKSRFVLWKPCSAPQAG